VQHFQDQYNFDHSLSDENKKRLSSITYNEVFKLFNDLDMSVVKEKIRSHLLEFSDEESYHGIFINIEDLNRSITEKIKHYGSNNYEFANEHCYLFYSLIVQQAIYNLFKRLERIDKRGLSFPYSKIQYTEGCAYKILKMVQLSNRVQRPFVVKTVFEDEANDTLNNKLPKYNKKHVVIEQIQPYGYYVEADINCSNVIKMYLNQVVETTSDDDKAERSTLPIMNISIRITDIYNFICESIWNEINAQSAIKQHCEKFHEVVPSDIASYKKFKLDLTYSMVNCVSAFGLL
jgi:hypothetical protein